MVFGEEKIMIKTFKLYIPLMVVITSLFLCSIVLAEAPDRVAKDKALRKTAVVDLETVDGNRLYNFANNRGGWGTDNNPLGYSTFWPGRDGSPASFAQGVWVAGTVNGEIRTACSDHSYEYNPGNIEADDSPADPDDARHQIVKINKADLLDEGFTNPDYNAWVNDLYQLGAPVLKAEDGSDSLSASGKRIPAMIGDQMLWMVYNDAAPGPHSYYGSKPIGLEVQNTMWVYNRPDAFGDMIFVKFLLINKGENTLEDAYIGLWFDIDLGDANDDLVFCDTTLSMGAFWNDGDDTYYDVPPAVGADFFQGPIVPSSGDTANVSGEKIPNFKNLGMTAFAKYIRNGPADAEDPSNSVEVYNFMQGLNGLGNDITDPSNGLVTKFVNISDPETGTGWVDGTDLTSSDRRMLMSSGPFTMEPWSDTNGDGIPQVGEPGVQEVVGGFMVAQGTTPKNSATRLKMVDELAQLAYDLNFALPPSPPNPAVQVHAMDQEVVLSWQDELETYRVIDRVDVDDEGQPTYYEFQGYNIYQTNTPTVGPNSEVIKLATYDIVDGVMDIQDQVFSEEFGEDITATVQRASDSGIRRMIRITTDALNGGIPLSNWNHYWFILTAYGYNPYGIPRILESPYMTIEVVPQQPKNGMNVLANYDDVIAAVTGDTTFNAEHTSAGPMSDGQIEVVTIDPTLITGKNYEVTFEFDSTLNQIVWNLDRFDGSEKTRLLSKQTNQTGDDGYTVVDGMMVKVQGPPADVKRMAMTANGNGPITETAGFDITPAPPYPGYSVDWFRDIALGDASILDLANGMQAGGGWYFVVAGGNNITDHEAFMGRILRDGDNDQIFLPNDYEIRFTQDGGYGVMAFTTDEPVEVPFELWFLGSGTLDDPSDDVRMIPWVLDIEHPLGYDIGDSSGIGVFSFSLDHEASSADNDPWSDLIYCYMPDEDSPGEAGYDQFVSELLGGTYDYTGTEHIARLSLMNWNMYQGDGSVNAMPDVGTIIRIEATKVNSVNDKFAFTTANFAPVSSEALAKAEAKQVNIFPNPYFGQNRAEVNPITRFVTLTHIPENDVTIRIFTISGSLVKTIDDDIRSEQGTLGTNTAQWDLRNDYDVPVASGIYIVHVDMGKLGDKVLKAAVFMPEERLDKF